MINFPYPLKQSKKFVVCLATKNKSKIKDFKLYIDKNIPSKRQMITPSFTSISQKGFIQLPKMHWQKPEPMPRQLI